MPLVVAGEGRARAELEAVAGPHTRFVGRVDDAELRRLFRSCTALLMPGVEDFGIVPFEAQACGTPVIAVDAGGTQDTVLPGVTGELVPPVAPAGRGRDLGGRAARLRPGPLRPGRHPHARRGSLRAAFRDRMRDVVAGVLAG